MWTTILSNNVDLFGRHVQQYRPQARAGDINWCNSTTSTSFRGWSNAFNKLLSAILNDVGSRVCFNCHFIKTLRTKLYSAIWNDVESAWPSPRLKICVPFLPFVFLTYKWWLAVVQDRVKTWAHKIAKRNFTEIPPRRQNSQSVLRKCYTTKTDYTE